MTLVKPEHVRSQLLRPLSLFRTYRREHVRADLVAGLTVTVILLPQAIAFSVIAQLPPQMGIYASIVAGLIGALWGSSSHMHTGPTNAMALLIASVLAGVALPGSDQYIVAAGMLAVMAGLLQFVMGMVNLGMLVDFVSHSVTVGFTAAAGILIIIKQIEPMLGLSTAGTNVLITLWEDIMHITELHVPTAAIGLGTLAAIVVLQRFAPRLPGPLIAMIGASAAVFLLDLDQQGVETVGQLPRSLPPLADLPLFDLELIAELSSGALAVAAIGMLSAVTIGRSISLHTGERVDSNQELVGQGLANVAAGFLSGYPVAPSFARSAVNVAAGAHSPLSAILSTIFLVVALFTLSPLAAYLPMAALAGTLVVTGYGLIDVQEIRRIWWGAREDALILTVTLLGTLFLRMEFAILVGILLSFAIYILKTSTPVVHAVVPDDSFRWLAKNPTRPQCPQMGILDIHGDLYFGATAHIERAIFAHLEAHPTQRFLLLRMHSVNVCDFTGIHMLESLIRHVRQQGGDLYLAHVRRPLLEVMQSTGLLETLGTDHILHERAAIEHMFYHVLDPAVCIYECPVRVFRECQNLPKPEYTQQIEVDPSPTEAVPEVEPEELWEALRGPQPPLVVDVREPREYERGHIPGAVLVPLPTLLHNGHTLPKDQAIVLVCRSGRRSVRAAHHLRHQGFEHVTTLKGGIIRWEACGLLEAVEQVGSTGEGFQPITDTTRQ
ncbi:MAG: SulP family inorganic anion transporter [Ardenticatenia bacterium]|nr:SulP family inorganic anion transporter [Ardenticatenia bacterium]